MIFLGFAYTFNSFFLDSFLYFLHSRTTIKYLFFFWFPIRFQSNPWLLWFVLLAAPPIEIYILLLPSFSLSFELWSASSRFSSLFILRVQTDPGKPGKCWLFEKCQGKSGKLREFFFKMLIIQGNSGNSIFFRFLIAE